MVESERPVDPDERANVRGDLKRALGELREAQPADPDAKAAALRRLRFATDAQLAVFSDRLREDARRAGGTERELRDAQRTHPEHG